MYVSKQICLRCSFSLRFPYLRNASEACWWCKAVATTERNITLTSDDVDRSLDHVWSGSSSTNGEELTHSDRLAGRIGEWQDRGIKVVWSEEVDVYALNGCWSEVAFWKRSKLRVGLGSAEVASEQEVCKERSILREAGETKTVRDVWVLSSEHVCLD